MTWKEIEEEFYKEHTEPYAFLPSAADFFKAKLKEAMEEMVKKKDWDDFIEITKEMHKKEMQDKIKEFFGE